MFVGDLVVVIIVLWLGCGVSGLMFDLYLCVNSVAIWFLAFASFYVMLADFVASVLSLFGRLLFGRLLCCFSLVVVWSCAMWCLISVVLFCFGVVGFCLGFGGLVLAGGCDCDYFEFCGLLCLSRWWFGGCCLGFGGVGLFLFVGLLACVCLLIVVLCGVDFDLVWCV